MSVRVAELFGVSPSAPLLEVALTHPSYANEIRAARHYQRLEFLGDAVLGLCATEILYERFPEADEGLLTRMRAGIVNADALATWARDNRIGEALRLGRGADSSGLRDSTNVLSDLTEALVAVAYLEGGIEGARIACKNVLEPALSAILADSSRDPKSDLQERVQRAGAPTPTYEVLESGGASHDPWFVVAVHVAGKPMAEGRGRSKQSAERAAAAAAIEILTASLDAATEDSGDDDA